MDTTMYITMAFFIILAAGFVQGLTSFGFALISLPLLSGWMPLHEAVPIIVTLSLLTNLAVVYTSRHDVNLKKIWLLVVSSLIAAPFGTAVLVFVPEAALRTVTGIVMVLFSAALLKGIAFPIRHEKSGFILVGLTSGLLNGSISLSGPPVALFLSNQGVDKQTFRANIAAYGTILNIMTIATYLYSGLLNREVAVQVGWMSPAMLLGVFLGIFGARKISEKLFKRIALFLIIISGLWTIGTGAGLF